MNVQCSMNRKVQPCHPERPSRVILSGAKDLTCRTEILRFAQDDTV
jgi:hypothetical protein